MNTRLLALATAAAALILTTAPAAAAGTPAPAGVRQYNTSVCGTSWVKVHIPDNSYYNFYNAPGTQASTCISVMRHHLEFGITSVAYRGAWGYPNVSSGWESGMNSCAGVSGACFKYPVEEDRDGNPVTSAATWQAPGTYNTAYDIWFNKTDAHPVQDNGTEVMIWLSHPGIGIWAVSRYVTVDGIRFAVMTWTARNSRLGVYWHYVAYVAVRQTAAMFAIHLNPFFADAIRHGELSPHWWLTGIDFGFELVRGGTGSNLHYYYLRGVR